MWNQFESHFRKVQLSKSVTSLIEWDQRTMMPSNAAAQRGEQLSFLETQTHALVTDQAYFDGMNRLIEDRSLTDLQRAAVRVELRRTKPQRKVPAELVGKISAAQARGFASWQTAREKKDFKIFQKDLETLVGLKKELGEHIKESGQTPYEGLIAQFEPGFALPKIEALLESLRQELVTLIPRMREKQPATDPYEGKLPMPVEQQMALDRKILEWMGFEFGNGRLDRSIHPFCGGAGSDIRLTTRCSPEDWTKTVFPTMHEGGHGMYEQGMEKFSHFTLREATGFGMHESQSRFWENYIGRSRAFCDWLLQAMRNDPEFKSAAEALDPEKFYRHVNRVEPIYIRVESDEATYNLHILLRFEIEAGLFRGDIKVAELPAVWREKVAKYLGLPAMDDTLGVLQDVHWSQGLFGYFPSYTLGNMIASQVNLAVRKELDLDKLISAGRLSEVRDWMNRSIHAYGCQFDTLDLVQKVTGQALSHRPLTEYLEKKFIG